MQMITKKLRTKVFKRDNFICAYCKIEFDEKLLQVDHIHPQSKGGKHEPKNLITSCKTCNCKKGNRILGYFIEGGDFALEDGDVVDTPNGRIAYPIRCIRLSDETWEKLCLLREKSGKTWNLFIKDLLLTLEEYEQNNTR